MVALLALQSHDNHALISVHVCMANRTKRVAACAAGLLVGQAVSCHHTNVIVRLTDLGGIPLKQGGSELCFKEKASPKSTSGHQANASVHDECLL